MLVKQQSSVVFLGVIFGREKKVLDLLHPVDSAILTLWASMAHTVDATQQHSWPITF